MQDLLDFATEIAEKAGEITLKYFGKPIDVESKADDSPVTVADRESEEFLRAQIEKRFPEDGILGEEFGEKAGTSGRRWILDPIDGTKSFIRGVPLYGTMVAVEVDGEMKVGVVRFPATAQTLAAREGCGCFLNGEKCAVSPTSEIGEATVLTTDMKDALRRLGDGPVLRFLRETKLQRTWGDCYGYLLIAIGRADVMFDPIMNLHDFAALIPIVNEAGGRITDHEGKPPVHGGTVLATNGFLHEAAIELLRKD